MDHIEPNRNHSTSYNYGTFLRTFHCCHNRSDSLKSRGKLEMDHPGYTSPPAVGRRSSWVFCLHGAMIVVNRLSQYVLPPELNFAAAHGSTNPVFPYAPV